MNRDYLEMLDALSAAGAEFLVVGAHALAVHGRPRATGDLDIWVRPTPENAARVWRALVAFGAPLDELTQSDLTTPGVVYQIGRAPDRVDLLTSISGVVFDEAWPARTEAVVDGRTIPVLGRVHLIATKRAVGRLRDLADIEDLESDAE
ncbi:MAG: nucleotidyltransferase [Thermoanaerobaculia bacterium]